MWTFELIRKTNVRLIEILWQQMSNGCWIFWISICCPFVLRCMGRRMFLCSICALEYSCRNRQPKICAQMVDKYCRHQFAVCLCTNSWQIFRTTICCPFVHKWFTDISERKGKENSMKIKKITLSENASNYHKKKNPYIRQQTDSKWLSDVLVHKRLVGRFISCPFALRLLYK